MKRVVVTGMGAVTPLGLTASEFWKNAVDGMNGIAPISYFDTTGYKATLAAELKGFVGTNYMEKGDARKYDLFIQYLIAAAEECVHDSGVLATVSPERVGTYVSSGIGGIHTTVREVTRMNEGASRLSPFLIPMMIANMGAGVLAMRHNIKGPSLPVVTACATSSNTIGEAFRAIKHGYCDAVLAGGSEAAVCPFAIKGFTACQALSFSNDVNAASIPFDARRDGFVMGEGAALLMLEEYEHAKQRNANIYAEVVGYGNTCDAHHFTAPDPEADGIYRAVKQAMEEGDITSVNENTYVNAHGTSTPLNDKTETMGYRKAFGENAKAVAVSSTKSMTGHMLGAAGAAEAITAIMALRDGVAAPTISYQEADPECDLFYCPGKAEKRPFDVAFSSSLGFGGHNAVLAFRKL